jgi:hypothetical protein
MNKKIKASVVGIGGGLLAAGNALAAVDLTGVTLDSTTPETLCATILIGLGVMWGIRKVIKTMNRS